MEEHTRKTLHSALFKLIKIENPPTEPTFSKDCKSKIRKRSGSLGWYLRYSGLYKDYLEGGNSLNLLESLRRSYRPMSLTLV